MIRYPLRVAMATGALLVALCSSDAAAQTPPPSSSDAPAPDSMTSPPRFDGLTLSAAYMTDVMANVRGGVRRGTAVLDNTDLILALDLERLVGWRGATASFYVIGNHGDSPSDLAGDLQILSNLDAPDTWKVFEAWIEQRFLSGRASVRAGLYNLNSELDASSTSSLFLNAAHTIGPEIGQTGENGPSIFPTTSLAVRFQSELGGNTELRLAVLDAVSGDPDNPRGTHISISSEQGALLIGEFARAVGPARLAAGAFWYTSTSVPWASLDGGVPGSVHNRGYYVLADGALTREAVDEDQGLSGFLRVGRAEGRVNQIQTFMGGGLVYAGLIPGRGADRLGLAVAHARNSGRFLQAQRARGAAPGSAETAFELTYAAHLLSWLSVRPDAQYIFNPGTYGDLSNALVLGLRVSAGF